VRLEFYFGDITILSSEGRERVQQEGMTIDEGDRVLTEEKAQAELSLNTYSRIDMDNFAEITFDKIGGDEEGKTLLELFQKTGLCWYKVAYTDKNEQYRILTPMADITIGGKGGDFTVDVKYSEAIITVLDGLVLVERPDGSDAMNLITGQSVTIYRDNRPFSISKIAPDENITERFNQLTKTKADIVMRHMPFNVLFCSPPQVFMLISVQFEQNKMFVIQLPPQTSVSLYVQGFKNLQESFLYGGAIFSSTLVERILNTRIQNFAIFTKDDIVRTASSIGGLKVTLDDQASAMLGLGKGTQALKGQRILNYLSPALSGSKDSEKRQIEAIQSIFNELVSKNIILTSLLMEQILSNIETNINAAEAMKHYNNFSSRKNWSFVSHTLPVRTVKTENQLLYEPIMEECRKLLTE
jgi:anionic cell wall polymer biosynthesis LytR-Cps2A-Psr (LCP) family protein